MHDLINPLDPLDPLDPRHLDFDAEREWRIYADDRAQVYALVDREDYEHFSRWLWKPKQSRGGKLYLKRDPGRGGFYRKALYLHIEIMKRASDGPPPLGCTIVDHRNGNSLDCRRRNLRWATPRMNRLNRHGCMPEDFFDERT